MKRKSNSGVFGVHPVLAALAGIALMLFGALLGVWFDRDDSPRPEQLPSAQRPIRAPSSVPQPESLVRQPPAFLSIPVDDYRRPDPIGPRPTAEQPAQNAPQVAVRSEPAASPASYAAAFSADSNLPAIAIVIDDMGLDRIRSQRMLELPGPLTMSFLTYASGLPSWSQSARRAGHEVLAHIPMEPLDPRENPGPNALTMALTAEELSARLDGMLGPWRGYVGVNNHMGSRFTADRWRMGLVMKDLKARGLLWLDSRTAPDSEGMAVAESEGVPYAARDFFLDNVATVEAIVGQLQAVEDHARKTGTAIAIGHPYDATLIALEPWITELPRRGFALAPVSEVARRRGHGFAQAVATAP